MGVRGEGVSGVREGLSASTEGMRSQVWRESQGVGSGEAGSKWRESGMCPCAHKIMTTVWGSGSSR